ncbi:MAG: pentapeptide repeat-containing protein [Proteobacteria bacterium]|nr:pentapeptide repeat-containing protein [Pseudomonadota bacterium]
MDCCLSEKYQWCKALPADYEDEMGDIFCIFHAPATNKGPFHADEFNSMVFELIHEKTKAGEPCSLAGTVFEWEISLKPFAKEIPLNGISFAEATFCHSVNFNHLIFSESVDFSGATFLEKADFEYIQFHGDALFKEAIFYGDAYFFDSIFSGKADFNKVVFDKFVYFSVGAFRGGGNFDEVRYGNKIIFKRLVIE